MTVSLQSVPERWAFLRATVMSSETFNWTPGRHGGGGRSGRHSSTACAPWPCCVAFFFFCAARLQIRAQRVRAKTPNLKTAGVSSDLTDATESRTPGLDFRETSEYKTPPVGSLQRDEEVKPAGRFTRAISVLGFCAGQVSDESFFLFLLPDDTSAVVRRRTNNSSVLGT